MGLKSVSGRFKNISFNGLSKDRTAAPRSFSFQTVAAVAAQPAHSSGAPRVVLVPFRTLVSYPFSFPFGRKGKVREALSLNFRPVLGDRESLLSLVPQITEQSASLTRGTAWFAAKSEIEEWESRLGDDAAFWPVQMAFVGEVNGSGLVVWHDEEGSSAMWFEEWSPVFCRWAPASDGGPEELAEWVGQYAASSGKTIGCVKIIESDAPESWIKRCCESALASVGGLESLDISNRGADAARQIESFFGTAFKTVRILSILGVIFLALSSLLLVQNFMGRSAFSEAPSAIYKSVFGEESNSPVTSAVRKLKVVTGSGDSGHMSLEQTLSSFAAAWKSASASGVTLDSIRYGLERTEIQGLADSMASVQGLRDSLAKNGFSAKVGEVQQVPKSGLRFTISLTGAGQ